MRQIKFRVWDSILKEMIAHEQLLEDQRCGPLTYGELVTVEECDSVLMQFTGLRDKNGKDVYEGDVVKTEHGQIGFVRWSDSGWQCFWPNGYKGNPEPYPTHLFHLKAPEVIGNVHEHSYLLDAP